MLRVAVAMAGLVIGAGCNSLLGIDDLSLRDAGGGGPDSPDASACVGHFIPVCLAAPPAGALTLATPINTDTDPRCETIHQATGGPDACAITAASIVVTADIIVTGGRPLILVAGTTITLDKKLDAGSHEGDTTGPGGSFTGCTQTTAGSASTTNGTGGGGGAGASFGTLGGAGGAGDNGPLQPMALPAENPTTLRGGCRGASGGANTSTGGLGGGGGAGGGAVYLIAATSITIDDELRASGAGGTGGTISNAGGGGGGSGGMLLLESPTITVTANGELDANGGGGGEGSRASIGHAGEDDKHWNMVAPGGTGQNDAGDGGPGAIASMPGGPGVMAGGGGGGGAGGGGGGGGGGIIRFHGALGGGNVSPPANTF